MEGGYNMLARLINWWNRRVPRAWKCPGCGMRDQDRLGWVDDDFVKCEKCGTVYAPGRES